MSRRSERAMLIQALEASKKMAEANGEAENQNGKNAVRHVQEKKSGNAAGKSIESSKSIEQDKSPKKKPGRPKKKPGRPKKKVGRPKKKVGRPKKSEQKKVEPEKKKSRKRDLSPVQNIEKPVGRKRGRGLQPTEANNTAIEKETKTLKARGADTTGTPSEGVEERAARELKNDVAIKIYWRKEMFEAKIKSYNAKTGKVEVLYRKDKTIEKVKLKDFYDRLIEIESSDGKGRNKNKKEAAPFSKTTGLLRASVMRPAKGRKTVPKKKRKVELSSSSSSSSSSSDSRDSSDDGEEGSSSDSKESATGDGRRAKRKRKIASKPKKGGLAVIKNEEVHSRGKKPRRSMIEPAKRDRTASSKKRPISARKRLGAKSKSEADRSPITVQTHSNATNLSQEPASRPGRPNAKSTATSASRVQPPDEKLKVSFEFIPPEYSAKVEHLVELKDLASTVHMERMACLLRLPPQTKLMALSFFHRWRQFCHCYTNFGDPKCARLQAYPPKKIVITSIFLACKMSDCPRSLRDMLTTSFRVFESGASSSEKNATANGASQKETPPCGQSSLTVGHVRDDFIALDQRYWAQKKEIVLCERHLLAALGFSNKAAKIPTMLSETFRALKINQKDSQWRESALKFLADCYHSAWVVLYTAPAEQCMAAIEAAGESLGRLRESSDETESLYTRLAECYKQQRIDQETIIGIKSRLRLSMKEAKTVI